MDQDLDPGGPKTCGSGSGTLAWTLSIAAPSQKLYSVQMVHVNAVQYTLQKKVNDFPVPSLDVTIPNYLWTEII